jgi:hypothetical protein
MKKLNNPTYLGSLLLPNMYLQKDTRQHTDFLSQYDYLCIYGACMSICNLLVVLHRSSSTAKSVKISPWVTDTSYSCPCLAACRSSQHLPAAAYAVIVVGVLVCSLGLVIWILLRRHSSCGAFRWSIVVRWSCWLRVISSIRSIECCSLLGRHRVMNPGRIHQSVNWISEAKAIVRFDANP